MSRGILIGRFWKSREEKPNSARLPARRANRKRDKVAVELRLHKSGMLKKATLTLPELTNAKEYTPMFSPTGIMNPKTRDELFERYVKEQNLKLDDIEKKFEGGWTNPEAYQMLVKMLEGLEAIVFEAKTKAGRLHAKMREIDSKKAKAHWDKTRGPEFEPNLHDPRFQEEYRKAQREEKQKKAREEKKKLTKMEQSIMNFFQMEYTDDMIVDLFKTSVKEDIIRETIERVREYQKSEGKE